MKKTAKLMLAILSLSALVSSASYAATEGSYAGLGLGASRLNTPTNFDFGAGINQSHDKGGLGGRVFGGHKFNENFGIEAGYAKYAQSKYSFTEPGIATGSLKYNLQAIDVVAKAFLPLADSGANVYGLGGVAYVNSKIQGAVQELGASFRGSKSQNAFRPIAGVGASYDIPNTPLTTALEYTHIFGRGNLKTSGNAIPSADMLSVNLAYNFG